MLEHLSLCTLLVCRASPCWHTWNIEKHVYNIQNGCNVMLRVVQPFGLYLSPAPHFSSLIMLLRCVSLFAGFLFILAKKPNTNILFGPYGVFLPFACVTGECCSFLNSSDSPNSSVPGGKHMGRAVTF